MNGRWSFLLAVGLVVACGDNKASLISNNDPNNSSNNTSTNNANNSTNNANNTSTNNANNSTNNANNSTNNGSNNGTNNVVNNTVDDIYDTVPAEDNRDYDGTIPARPTDATEAFVYDMVEAFCEQVVLCRAEYPVARQILLRGISTKGDCMQDYFNRNPLASFSASVAENRSQFFPDNVTFCPMAIAQATCGEIALGFDSPGALVESCQEALTGLSGPNDPCYSNADCGAGLYCVLGTDGTCGGTCTEVTVPSVYCGETGETKCAAGEYCDVSDFGCKAYKANSAACTEDYECTPGSFCHNGTCDPIKFGYQEGQVCNFYSNICAMGLYCDAPDLENGTCTPLRKTGESCEALSDCVYSARCDGTTCLGRADEGACTFFDDCLSGACQNDGACMSTTMACVPPPI